LILIATPALTWSAYVNFEGKQTSPVRISPDGARLFAVNTPDCRLSVFDLTDPKFPILIKEIAVGLEPVSVNPRSSDEAWVINEVSDNLSIVSVSNGIVETALQVGDEPADVVFAKGRAFVTVARENAIVVFDISNRTQIATIPLEGENPRALVVNSDGTRVYTAFALSGNATTIIPAAFAPAQPSPTVITNAPPQVGLIVAATNTAWAAVIQYNMPDHDIAEIDVCDLVVTGYVSGVGTVNLGVCCHPSNGNLYVANTEARNLVHFEPNLRGHAVDNRITCITTNGDVIPWDLNPGINYAVLPNAAALSNALAQPTAIVCDPNSANMYVAAFGTDRVACIDTNCNVLVRIEMGNAPGAQVDPRNKRGPRGLAMHPTEPVLYVLNRIANTLSIVCTSNNTVLAEVPVGSHDPTPAVIREGRGFLYDAKLSGNGTMACAACHIDAEMDMVAWDLGDPAGSMQQVITIISNFPVPLQMHPMKGPMITQTLRGLDGLNPLHWRGDRTNFLAFNPAFDSLLGGSQLSAADMETYRDFIDTIVFHPNPNQNLDRTLPASFAGGDPIAGRNTFLNEAYIPGLTCNTCHVADPGPGANGVIIPAAALQLSQDFKIPHLRNIYKKLSFSRSAGTNSVGGFGFLHDGTFDTIFDFLSEPVFGIFATDPVRKRNLNAFLQCFDTGTAPAMGHVIALCSSNIYETTISNTWTVLEGQAAVSNIDLIAHGRINGRTAGLLYDPNTQTYQTDRTNEVALTRAQIEAALTNACVLTVMGVGHGCGMRAAIDRDDDGTLDADETGPEISINLSSDGTLTLAWPSNDFWFVLESASEAGATTWNTVFQPRGIVAGTTIVTNPADADRIFFRLRRPW
jgi:YVTN family beta-propeller protein